MLDGHPLALPSPTNDEARYPSPKDALGLARLFLDTHGWTLWLHDDRWWFWARSHYVSIEAGRLEGEIWKWSENLGDFTPTCTTVRNILKALEALRRTPVGTGMPCWLGERVGPTPENLISFRNGLLDVSEGQARFLPHSPAWFSPTCIPHSYEPAASCPIWENFLDEVFEGDGERIRAMQQWFGYNLVPDISQHKFALMSGPPGAGKSVCLRTLGDMLGADNVATPTLTTLWRFYGMETIHTKTAALVGDAHLETSAKATASLEKLKSVVGGDRQNIDRKGKDELANRVVKVRFTIAVNELPQFPDSAAALGRRLLPMPFHRTFQGREDRHLNDKFLAEMPGIIAWALRGLFDLRASGAFHMPKAGQQLIDDLTHLGSPVKEFLEDCCELGPDFVVPSRTLWEAWGGWCKANGHRAENSARFGAMLKAAHPGIDRCRSGRDERGNQRRFYRGVRLRLMAPVSR